MHCHRNRSSKYWRGIWCLVRNWRIRERNCIHSNLWPDIQWFELTDLPIVLKQQCRGKQSSSNNVGFKGVTHGLGDTCDSALNSNYGDGALNSCPSKAVQVSAIAGIKCTVTVMLSNSLSATARRRAGSIFILLREVVLVSRTRCSVFTMHRRAGTHGATGWTPDQQRTTPQEQRTTPHPGNVDLTPPHSAALPPA